MPLNAQNMPTKFQFKTDRLLLTPVSSDDENELHGIFTDQHVRRYLLDDEIVPQEFTHTEIENSQISFEKNDYGLWMIRLSGEQKILGFCGYRPFYEPPELQILYGLLQDFWGNGYAAEATKALIKYGFETLQFEEIIAATDPPNEASVRVMERVGMAFDKRVEKNGADTIYYKIKSIDYSDYNL